MTGKEIVAALKELTETARKENAAARNVLNKILASLEEPDASQGCCEDCRFMGMGAKDCQCHKKGCCINCIDHSIDGEDWCAFADCKCHSAPAENFDGRKWRYRCPGRHLCQKKKCVVCRKGYEMPDALTQGNGRGAS